jgi:hypothetical protein
MRKFVMLLAVALLVINAQASITYTHGISAYGRRNFRSIWQRRR